MNTVLCWMTTPRSADETKFRVVGNVANTWLYRCDQLERDPSLLFRSFFSSPIDGQFITDRSLTYKDRMSFNQIYRHF